MEQPGSGAANDGHTLGQRCPGAKLRPFRAALSVWMEPERWRTAPLLGGGGLGRGQVFPLSPQEHRAPRPPRVVSDRWQRQGGAVSLPNFLGILLSREREKPEGDEETEVALAESIFLESCSQH